LDLLKKGQMDINEIEEDGILVIDDTIIERGKNIEYASLFIDHNKKEYVRGYQVATSLLVVANMGNIQ